MRDARAQAAGDERQVRVGVERLDRLLLIGQLRPPLQVVVLVPRALREHRPEDVDIRHDARMALIEARRHALIEVAGGGVERAAERAGVVVEDAAVSSGDDIAHVDDVDARTWDQLEGNLGRRWMHSAVRLLE